MDNIYLSLQDIWARHLRGERNIERDILDLLSRHGIKIRQNDGALKQITVSIPTSVDNAFVIGLRYIKADGTRTEDLFLCQDNAYKNGVPVEIEPHYKGRLEFRLPEYRGTHKEQVDFGQAVAQFDGVTQVNTITHVKG
jgi:hypothetical protein